MFQRLTGTAVFAVLGIISFPAPSEAQLSYGPETEYTRIGHSHGHGRASMHTERDWFGGLGETPRQLPQEQAYLDARPQCGPRERHWALQQGDNVVEYLQEQIPEYYLSIGEPPRGLDTEMVREVPFITHPYTYKCETLKSFLEKLKWHHGNNFDFQIFENVVEMVTR